MHRRRAAAAGLRRPDGRRPRHPAACGRRCRTARRPAGGRHHGRAAGAAGRRRSGRPGGGRRPADRPREDADDGGDRGRRRCDGDRHRRFGVQASSAPEELAGAVHRSGGARAEGEICFCL